MHNSSVLSIFAIVAAVAYAAAVPASSATIEARGDVSVYLCTDRNFQGYCVDAHSNPSECVNLGPDLNDRISSVGPDGNNLCYFFVDADCSTNGDFIHYTSPGVADLSVAPVNGPPGSTRNFEDKISSYFCVA